MLIPKIVGTGSYVPENIVTNLDVEKIVDTSEEWILSRTGIITRHKCNDDQTTSEISYCASRQAMDMSGTEPEEIDLIIVGTASPDLPFPSTACLLQSKLGAKNAAAFDLTAACTGFIYGLSIGEQFIKSGRFKTILVVGAEILTKVTNYNDRTTCILFGDGAGAAIMKNHHDENGLFYTKILSDGNLEHLIQIPAGGTRLPLTHELLDQNKNKIHMRGNETFKYAVRLMHQIVVDALEANDLEPEDIALFIPHQANIRIIKALSSRLKFPLDKVWINIDKYGNTSAASVPIALDEAVRAGKVKEGDLIVMVAFGGGLTYGTAIYRW